MPLGWVHFSQEFRDKVNTILDMMEEEGMVDELGVGVFRDAFADIFFPGISTVQRSAKYFFIIPYLIKDYQNLPLGSKKGLEKYLLDRENKIMWDLANKYNHDRNSDSGVIGITKHFPERIAIRPSSIYWNGMRQFDFIRTSLNLSEYSIRVNELQGGKIARTVSMIEGESDDSDVELSDDFSIRVSTYRKDWENNLDLPLDYDEADFFRNRIIKSVPGSLLELIFSDIRIRKLFFSFKNFAAFARSSLNLLPSNELRNKIILAHDLNEVVAGLSIIYSNEINKHHFQDDRFFVKWQNWSNQINLINPKNLSGERLLEIVPNAGYNTSEFIREVLDMIRKNHLDYTILAELVRSQERNIKKQKSRFRQGSEIDFNKGEAKSLSSLNYRYSNARRIVRDIYEGLKK